MTSKGQLTLPKAIRDHLGLGVGSKVEFIIDEQVGVIMKPKTLDVTEVFGMFERCKVVTIEGMRRGR